MRTLNLGVVAHVDAGKTSLTERLLYAGGVIDEIGSVDDGSTQTDSLALERQRGITIKSAVVSFDIGDVSVNLIDTPGHPDFIAEVERVLSVLDGAVLVVSAVEGVQAQTRVLMRTLRRLGIPTLVFVNKIDRGGARDRDVVDAISARLAPGVAMTSVADLGTRAATSTPLGADDAEHTAQLVDLLADHDSAFLAAYVDADAAVSYRRLRAELTELTRCCLVHPVFFGSAITGAGVDDLIAGVHDFLPSGQADLDAPVSGSVFKIERGPAGEKIAFTRMFAGTIRVRDRVRVGAREGKVTAVRVFEHGAAAQRAEVSAGAIAQLWGLADARIGDTVGAAGDTALTGTDAHHFAPPTLETVVDPVSAADRGRLLVALTQLAEQDPLIDLRQDDIRQEVFVSLYGEVQKEVIGSTLADEYGIDVTFRETTTICVERPTGVGEAVELIGTAMNPFLATVGLRVEAGEVESGVRCDLGVELGSMPSAFFATVDETLGKAVQQGLHGWPVTDAVITLTHSGYWARQSHAHGTFDASMSSTAGDFRNLTPLVLMDALRRAGTVVCEPVHRFRLEVPADLLSPALSALSRLQGVPLAPQLRDAVYVLEGDIPAARIHELQQLLPSVSRGEGMLESAFERYEPVHGVVPTRARTDLDPLHRDEYVRRVTRRV